MDGLILAWLLGQATPVAPPPEGPSGVAPATCSIEAWSTGETPAERRIHAGPDAESPVLATMPPPIEFAGYSFKVTLEITGARDGWFRIHRATTSNTIVDDPLETVFEGEGWVSGEFVGLLLNRVDLYAAPFDDESEEAIANPPAVVGRLAAADAEGVLWGPDSATVERLLDCRGDWVLVEATLLGHALRGWTSGTCANQLTTCP